MFNEVIGAVESAIASARFRGIDGRKFTILPLFWIIRKGNSSRGRTQSIAVQEGEDGFPLTYSDQFSFDIEELKLL